MSILLKYFEIFFKRVLKNSLPLVKDMQRQQKGRENIADILNEILYYNKNEILFGDISETGVIAMCLVWGIFGGPPPFRELVEFDIVFDDDGDFEWGYAGVTNEEDLGDTSVMDLQNIATHEIGHALGLADLDDNTAPATEQTMYGFATEGETKKRTLEAGDVAGVNALYG